MNTPEQATNWRCRHAWHSWRFKSMADRRWIDTPYGGFGIGTVSEDCRRCGLKRINAYTDLHKKKIKR